MSVGQPAQQIGDISTVGAGEAGAGVGIDIVGQTLQGGGQCRGIVGHLAGVGYDHRQESNGFGQRPAINRCGQPDVDPGLIDEIGSGISVGPDLKQGAVGVAADSQRGMHQRDIGDAQSVQQNRDRVHQHGGLVGDDLQGRTESAWIVGAVDLDESLADPTSTSQVFLGGDQRRYHRRVDVHGFIDTGDRGARVRTAVGGLIRLGDGAVNRHTVGAPESARVPTLVRALITLVPRQPAMGHSVRTGRLCSESLELVLLIRPEIALEPEPRGLIAGITLPGKDVGAGSVQEPAVVGDHHRTSRKLLQRVLQRTECLNIEVVGGLVEQQKIAALLEGQRQVEPVALTAGEHTGRLLLIGALESEG